MIKFFKIKNKEELENLKKKSARYEELSFSFTDKYISELKDLLDHPNSCQIFAKEKNEMAGYIASAKSEDYPGYLFIHELFVDPKFQSKGIGSGLIEKIMEFAKEKKYGGLITETEFKNIPAQKLYEKMGFAKFNNPRWEKGVSYKLSLK